MGLEEVGGRREQRRAQLEAVVICRWPDGCVPYCPPFTYQPQAIPLALGAKERQGPSGPQDSLLLLP